MAEANVCFICEKAMTDNIVVVQRRGVENLRVCSDKRQDGKAAQFLNNIESVIVHNNCRKTYINERMIKSALNRKDKVVEVPVVQTLRSRVSIFNFKNSCFLCDAVIDEDFYNKQKKKRVEIRDVVYQVRTLSMKDTVLALVAKRNDDLGEKIRTRIANVDLVAVEAQYHHSCMKKFSRQQTSERSRGYRPATQVDKAMEFIYSYLEEYGAECQFSLNELCDQINRYRPDMRTIKSRLLEKYSDDIIIVSRGTRPTMVCYKNTGYKILSEGWYTNKESDMRAERLRVVNAAAGIVLEDIRSEVYETQEYPPSDRFLEGVTAVIPETLSTFIEGVILRHKRSSKDTLRVKCTALCHAIIAAVRPRSFLSPLQIGLGTFLYQKFGSKELLNIVSALGFSASYHECVLFQLSAIMRPGIKINMDAFSQFSFDNADFNTNTLDGLHTFHAMGGIQSVTPRSAVVPDQTIPRLKKTRSAAVVSEFSETPLQTFSKRSESGLSSLTIEDLESLHPVSTEVLPSIFDLMWLYGKFTGGSSIPGWNGFMEQVTASLPFQKSFVLCLPFINAPPSDYDTIYTALCLAAEKCKSLQQHTCFVTFDLPLYIKARDIIGNGDENSCLRIVEPVLGGFHLLMSFMGAIGYLMAGSGLKELWSTIYAQNSIDKMLSGHAYSRAVRAHMLTHLALSKIILQDIVLYKKDKDELQHFLLENNRFMVLSASENEAVRTLAENFRQKLLQLEQNGATAKLWLQYFQMVCLVKRFIEAERMGNWQLHLDTIQQMLPFFHASGHFPYAKASRLYLQDMLHLEARMDPAEYKRYTEKGYFTIRRSDKFWSGIWSDMTIEQTLMRTMKSIGGLTHGRGITNSVLTKWTLGMVYLYNVCDAMEEYCGISVDTTEQHVDMREARVCRDSQDVHKLLDFFAQHSPFPKSDGVISISTGIIGNSSINCHMAREVGTTAMQNIIGQTFACVKLKRKDRVLPLSTINSSIKIGEVVVPINPLLLFQRMCIVKRNEQQLQEYLHYELAPFPLSLFTEQGMRKGIKSSLYAVFEPIKHTLSTSNIHVVDGGHLLHKVRWHINDHFSSICSKYLQYVEKHYGSNTIIVFDGYPSAEMVNSTKTAERLRRSRVHKSLEIVFDESMKVPSSQERFLSNESNKDRLIAMLKKKFEEAHFQVKQATEDADVLIVTTALEMSSFYTSVYIVGEDIDLIVLLTALGHDYGNIYFRKPGKGKVSEKIYTSRSLQYDETVVDNILFLHAFSGCDTTSSIYNQGKVKFFKTLGNSRSLSDIIAIFKNRDAEPASIAEAGENFFIELYVKHFETNSTLDSLRYNLFAKCAAKRTFHLASLPPTTEAARQHSYRTYHQVQQWLGVQKNPLDWGWKKSRDGLIAITTQKEPAPANLLNCISCKCQKGCGAACSCRKAGLKCSRMCAVCNGNACSNVTEICLDDDHDDELDVLQNINSVAEDVTENTEMSDDDCAGPSSR